MTTPGFGATPGVPEWVLWTMTIGGLASAAGMLVLLILIRLLVRSGRWPQHLAWVALGLQIVAASAAVDGMGKAVSGWVTQYSAMGGVQIAQGSLVLFVAILCALGVRRTKPTGPPA